MAHKEYPSTEQAVFNCTIFAHRALKTRLWHLHKDVSTSENYEKISKEKTYMWLRCVEDGGELLHAKMLNNTL